MQISVSDESEEVASLFDKYIQPETDVVLGNLIIETQIIPEHYIEDDTTFKITKEKLVLNKITAYKSTKVNFNPIQDVTGTSGSVTNMVTSQINNVSRCFSRFQSWPIFQRFNFGKDKYESPLFESKATIKLPVEIKQKRGSIYYTQLSKITFTLYYGKDTIHVFFSPNVLDEQEWVLDCNKYCNPEYSKEGLMEFNCNTDTVTVHLSDRPNSQMPFKLTRVVRKQKFLLFLVMEIDGERIILHSLKWYIEFEWSANSSNESYHDWGILPCEEMIPESALKFGNCNDNQLFFYVPGENATKESTVIEPYPNYTYGLSLEEFIREVKPKLDARISKH